MLKVKKDAEKIRKKRMKVTEQKYRKLYLQRMLDQIDKKAEGYDREIFRLTNAGNYKAAKRKYVEFQTAMIEDLARLKKMEALWKVQDKYRPPPEKKRRLY